MMKLKTFGFILLTIIGVAGRSVHAQPQGPPKYKEGDRVELDILETGDPAKAKWVKATITKVTMVKLSSTLSQITYTVTCDPAPGQLPKVVEVSQRLAEQGMSYSGDPSRAIGFVRPLGAGNAGDGTAGGNNAGPRIETDKLHVDDHDTVLADRELLDCKNLKAGPARNGPPPPTELAKKLIRCLFEAPSAPGQDGATKVDIIDFSAGVRLIDGIKP